MKIKLLGLLVLLTIQSVSQAQITRPGTPTTQNTLLYASMADLVVSIKAIEPNGSNFTVVFTIRNQGGNAVDLSKVTVQGNVYSLQNNALVSAGGGTTLVNYGTINKMQEVEAQMQFTPTVTLLSTETFLYRLKVDEANAIAEADEGNNLSDYKFRGNASQTPTTPNSKFQNKSISLVPDLTIQINSVIPDPNAPGGYLANYTIKNIGTGSCNLKDYIVQGSVRDNSTVNFAPAGGHSLMYEGTVLDAGKEFKGSRGISANLAPNKTYIYKIELKANTTSSTNPERDFSNNAWEQSFSTSN